MHTEGINIINYENLYKLFRDGSVYGLKYKKFLKPKLDRKGYYYYSLCKQSKHKNIYIHRLIATHFIANPCDYKEVNHINGNPGDNQINNLEWVTHHQNMLHASKTGLLRSGYKKKPIIPNLGIRVGENNYNAKLTEKEVLAIRAIKEAPEYISLSEVATMYGISKYTVKNIWYRNIWKHI